MRWLAGRMRLLVVLAVLSMLAVLVAAVVALIQVRQTTLVDTRNVNWRDSVTGLVFGFEREYVRFRGELAIAARLNAHTDLNEARLRYEILVSRIDLIRTASSLDTLRDMPQYRSLMDELTGIVTVADALFRQPDPPAATVRALLARMDRAAPEVQSYTRAATVATARLVEQQFVALRRQAALIGTLAAVQVVFAMIAGLLLWAQHRQESAARRKLEILADELRAATEAADAANRTKSQFLANMSHELRTPFQGVTGMLALLEKTDLTAQQQDLIRTSRESAEHLLTLLNDVLDVSAIEAGRVVLDEQPLNLHRLCRDVRHLMRGQAFSRGLRLELVMSSSLPKWVRGDATRIKQVLFNLLSNAIKFTPAGEIVLTVRATRAGMLSFRVADTGIGMDEGTLARLFHRFSMGDETLSRRFGGAGLGLEISRNLARMMNGDLTAQSALGKGSIFTFTAALPRCEAPDDAPMVSVQMGLPERKLTVLVADDHPINRKYLALVLSSMGHRCELCEDGHQAVQAARDGRFDAILMDIHMPQLDGLRATAAIRALPGPAAGVPILMLTADVMPATRERAAAAGATACLHKPIQGPELADALAAAVQNTQGPAVMPPPAPPPPHVQMPPAPAQPLQPPKVLSSRFSLMMRSLPPTALAGLVDMFFRDESRTLSDLRAALDGGDPHTIMQAAHKLKGSARMLGFKRIAARAAEIEDQEGAGAATRSARQAWDSLQAAVHETQELIAELQRSGRPPPDSATDSVLGTDPPAPVARRQPA